MPQSDAVGNKWQLKVVHPGIVRARGTAMHVGTRRTLALRGTPTVPVSYRMSSHRVSGGANDSKDFQRGCMLKTEEKTSCTYQLLLCVE